MSDAAAGEKVEVESITQLRHSRESGKPDFRLLSD
jgi:hypothetical protein